jgi:hypothetical protein
LVLCSVKDVAGAVAELHRVVRPGGEFRFNEHVASEHPLRRALQRTADATLWSPTIFCGCHLGRDTEKALEDSAFRVERIERFVFNVSALDPPKVTFSEPPAASELIADSFGCGLDSMQRFLDAAAKLLVARDGQFGYPVSDRAPQKTVGLNHLGAGTDLPKFVAPQSFFAALLVQGCERKLRPGSATVTIASVCQRTLPSRLCPRNRAPSTAVVAPSSQSHR